MITSTVHIRRLTSDDFEAFKQMDTGIDNDYIARIFRISVNREETYGAFRGGQLVSMAAFTVFAGRYAILGRLRTDQRFRGRGFSTNLLTKLCDQIDANPELRWVGLATETSNHPVQHIAGKLQMNHLSTFYSCILDENKQDLLASQYPRDSEEWVEVDGSEEKRKHLKKLSPQENRLKIFPYECYYPLPYETDLWTDDYLEQCTLRKRGDRFVMMIPDEKGNSYLHVKYFWDDCFSQPGLWQTLIADAKRIGRKLWIDLPYTQKFIEIKAFFERTAWMCYGRVSPAKPSSGQNKSMAK